MTTLLSDGRVLTVGGFTTDEGSRASAEVYNPETGTWSAAGEMSIGRWCAAATRLPDGRVLVAGGWYVNGWASVILDSAELFDPTAPPETAWSETGSMAASRRYHTAGLLPNGRVLVAGGDSDGHPTLTTELYDPATGTWSQAAPMAMAHAYYQTATLLPDGRLLVVGGHDNSTFFADAEVYDSSQASWTAVNALSGTRGEHAAILLADDRVLVTGGQRYDGGWIGLDSTETYDAYTGTWWPAARMGSPRSGHSATLLANGQVLAAGGRNGSPLASAELYDPAADVWRPTAAMDDARSQHTATLLPSGQVLVAGGDGAMGPLATAELYEPVSGVWLPAGSMGTSRTWHTATLLPNGAVLVAGGYNQDLGWLAGVELYDPATGTWSAVASLAQGRGRHRATLLPDGRVLVAGGIGDGDAALATAEVYDPACGCWSTTGSLAHARAGYEEIVLRDGHVLVAGGFDPATGVQPSSEVYNPATGTWSLDATANVAAAEHTLTLLPGGQVLAAGGLNGNSALGSAQVYDRGLGYDPAWRPFIDSVPASLLPGDPVTVTGSGFRGHGFVEAASSTYSSSPTNYPLVQLQRLDNGQVRWLLPDSLHPFSDTLFTSVPVTELAAGPYLVTVFVNGIDSASQMTCVLAEPVNHPPQIEAIEPEAVDELVTLSFLVPASDPDAGDKLTFSLAPDAPAGAMVGPATGEFSWIPTEAQGPGTYSVTVVVADSGIPPLSDVALFTVTVHEVNQAPVAANDVHTVGQDMVLDVPAPGVSGNDVDLDLPRQALTVTLQTGPFHGNLFLGMDGGFVYTPALSFRNIDTFTYAVSDGELGDVAVVTLTVGTAGVQTIYLPVVIRGGG